MPQIAIATCLTGTISNTAVAITALTGYSAAKVDVATRAYITAITNACVVTWNGTTPTATVGHVIAANGTLIVDGQAKIEALQFIRLSADVSLTITLETD